MNWIAFFSAGVAGMPDQAPAGTPGATTSEAGLFPHLLNAAIDAPPAGTPKPPHGMSAIQALLRGPAVAAIDRSTLAADIGAALTAAGEAGLANQTPVPTPGTMPAISIDMPSPAAGEADAASGVPAPVTGLIRLESIETKAAAVPAARPGQSALTPGLLPVPEIGIEPAANPAADTPDAAAVALQAKPEAGPRGSVRGLSVLVAAAAPTEDQLEMSSDPCACEGAMPVTAAPPASQIGAEAAIETAALSRPAGLGPAHLPQAVTATATAAQNPPPAGTPAPGAAPPVDVASGLSPATGAAAIGVAADAALARPHARPVALTATATTTLDALVRGDRPAMVPSAPVALRPALVDDARIEAVTRAAPTRAEVPPSHPATVRIVDHNTMGQGILRLHTLEPAMADRSDGESGLPPVTLRVAAPPSHPAAAQPTPAPLVPVNGLAMAIAQQARDGVRRFDIRLDPPELGRIEIRMEVTRGGQVTTHLVVERSETLDLLQRDARSLERALHNAGLDTTEGGLKFSLKNHGPGHEAARDGADARNRNEPDSEAGATQRQDDDAAQLHPRRHYVLTGGLDIRI